MGSSCQALSRHSLRLQASQATREPKRNKPAASTRSPAILARLGPSYTSFLHRARLNNTNSVPKSSTSALLVHTYQHPHHFCLSAGSRLKLPVRCPFARTQHSYIYHGLAPLDNFLATQTSSSNTDNSFLGAFHLQSSLQATSNSTIPPT